MLFNTKKNKAKIGHNFYITKYVNSDGERVETLPNGDKNYYPICYQVGVKYKLIGFNEKADAKDGWYAILERLDDSPAYFVRRFSLDREVRQLCVKNFRLDFLKKYLFEGGTVKKVFDRVFCLDISPKDMRFLESSEIYHCRYIVDRFDPFTLCKNRKALFKRFSKIPEDDRNYVLANIRRYGIDEVGYKHIGDKTYREWYDYFEKQDKSVAEKNKDFDSVKEKISGKK